MAAAAMSSEAHAEISENDARGEIARVYTEIRRAMAVPVVALFYLNLAAIEGALPWMWSIVAPLAEAGRLATGAARVAVVGDLQAIDVAVPRKAQPILAVLAAYNRANPFNVVCAALLDAVLRSEQGAPRVRREPAEAVLLSAPERLPAMVPVSDIPPDLRNALAWLAIADTRGDGIVPSLYRHLAHWPHFLRDAADAMAPYFVDGEVQDAARLVAQVSREEAAALLAGDTIPVLPRALQEKRDQVVLSVDKFSRRIPEMIVVGRLLTDAVSRGMQE